MGYVTTYVTDTYVLLTYTLLQEGRVLVSRIVPDDTRVHVFQAMKTVLATVGRIVKLDVIYTDDFMKDHKKLETLCWTLKLKVTGEIKDVNSC